MRMKPVYDNNSEIKKLLAPIGRRVSSQHHYLYLLRGLVGGLLLSLLLLVISMIIPWPGVSQICLQVIFAGLLLAGMMAWGRRPSLFDVAVLVDCRGLKERVSTSLEFMELESPVILRQRQDALNQLRTYNWQSAFPWVLPKWETRLLAAATLLIALLCIIPNPQQDQLDKQLAINKEIKQQEKKIAEIKKELQKKEAEHPNLQRREAIQELQELQDKLGQNRSLKQALNSLGSAEDRLANLSSAEFKRSEAATANSRQGVQNGKAAATANKGNESLSEPQNVFSTKQSGQSAGRYSALADLQQAVRSVGDARMALLGAANNSQGRLAAVNSGAQSGNGRTGNEESGNSATGASGVGGAANAPGASGASNPGEAAGQQGMGNSGSGTSGNGIGSQSGSSNQPGGSGSGSGAGRGSGSGDTSSGQQSSENNNSSGMAYPDMNYREYEKIYDPDRLGINGEKSVVRGEAGKGPQQMAETSDPALEPGNLRPYREVIGQYSQAARESLGRSSIPAGMNEVVKDYFSSLEE